MPLGSSLRSGSSLCPKSLTFHFIVLLICHSWSISRCILRLDMTKLTDQCGMRRIQGSSSPRPIQIVSRVSPHFSKIFYWKRKRTLFYLKPFGQWSLFYCLLHSPSQRRTSRIHDWLCALSKTNDAIVLALLNRLRLDIGAQWCLSTLHLHFAHVVDSKTATRGSED